MAIDPDAPIDAEELVRTYSVEDLAASADEYYARLTTWDYLLAKPFGSVAEAPTVLAHLGAMLSALELEAGMTVLDFGAGGGWTTRVLVQLGCTVTACDVSGTALEIARRRFTEQAVYGAVVEPVFSHFDGHRLDAADESMHRVACMDAFHHVPNRGELLAEFVRVLRPGGRAVFVEPGPDHSRTPQAQAEMRGARVVERDIVVAEVAREAHEAGFLRTDVGIYAGAPSLVPADDFDRALAAGAVATAAAQHFLQNHRLLVMHKAGRETHTSRAPNGLAASIDVQMAGAHTGRVRITNTGTATWLPSGSGIGAVNLGVQLRDDDGRVLELDHHRVMLATGDSAVIEPAAVVEVGFELPQRPPGVTRLAFDLVAEGVAWFEMLGNPPVSVDVSDLPG